MKKWENKSNVSTPIEDLNLNNQHIFLLPLEQSVARFI